jgi:PsbP
MEATKWAPFVVLAGSSAVALPARAAALAVKTFNDPTHGFSIELPSTWAMTEQQLFDRRRLLVWTDPSDVKTAVFIAYTPVRDDFTSLNSFGSVDQVAAQTIMPKGKLMDENSEVAAKMLKAESKKQAYIFDYTQSVGDLQPETHFRTIFALQQGATGGAGAVLITITAQTPESNYDNVKSTLDAIVDSYEKSV